MVSYKISKAARKRSTKNKKKSDKEYAQKLNYENIEFPVAVKQFNKIEVQNNININVFGYENKQPFPIYISKEKIENEMNLLLITKNEKNMC